MGCEEEINSEYSPPTTLVDLPPFDRGFHAWKIVAISFLIEGLVWGPLLAFGVFLEYPPYKDSNVSFAAFIGSFSSCVVYSCTAVLTPLLTQFPTAQKWTPGIGALLCVLGLVGAAFSKAVWELFLTQGLMYGMGAGLLFASALVIITEWWIARRGLAGGIMFSGTCLTALFPNVLDWSLRKHGVRYTYLGLSLIYGAALLPTLPFFQGRTRKPDQNVRRGVKTAAVKNPVFWAIILLAFIQGLAFFVPYMFLPLFMERKNLEVAGDTILTIFLCTTALGQLVVGASSDYFPIEWINLTLSLVSGSAVLTLWKVDSTSVMLIFFAIIFGLTAGGFSSLWNRFATKIVPNDAVASSALVGFFVSARGLASALTGPIAGHLIDKTKVGGEGYRGVITYCGILMLLSAFGSMIAFGRSSGSPEKEKTDSSV